MLFGHSQNGLARHGRLPPARTLFLLAAAAVLAALLLPFAVNVNRYRFRIAGELQARLGRPVQVGGIRLKLLPGPGFALRNVAIGDDPAFGAEPFLRAGTLNATLRLRSLWTGRLSFSSLVFLEPSVNLARNASGHWNIESILARGDSRSTAPPPYVEMRDGRINFKSGDTKSVFFLSGVDAALYLAAGRVNLRLTGAPARTDRMLTDIGQLRAEASFPATGRAPATGDGLKLRLELTDAYLADLLALTVRSDLGIRGLVQLRTDIEEAPQGLWATGSALVSNLHRWDMLPPEGNPALEFRFEGTIDVGAGAINVERLQAPLGAGMLEGSGRIENLPDQPTARFRVNFSGARASSVLAGISHFSSRPFTGATLEGTLDGSLQIQALPLTVAGFVSGRNLKLGLPGLPGARVGEARVEFGRSSAELRPVAIELDGGRKLTLGAGWDWNTGHASLSASGHDIGLPTLAAFLRAAGLDLIPSGVALLAETRVSGSVDADFPRAAAPRLSGWAQLSRVRWRPPGVASAVTLHTARLDLLPNQVRASRLVASWAGGTITGALRLPLRSDTTRSADLQVNEWRASALAAALRERGRLPLISSVPALGGPAAAQPAEREKNPMRAEGRITVGRLLLGRLELSSVEANFRLSGRRVVVDRARAAFSGGQWEGLARLDFSGASPSISLDGRLSGVSLAEVASINPAFAGLAEGRADASLTLTSSGWQAPELMRNLNMKLRLETHDLLLRNLDLEGLAAGQASAIPGISRVEACTATLAVSQRRVRIERATFRTADGNSFKAEGTVDFDRTADVRVEPAEAPGPPRLQAAPFRLVGPIEAPRMLAIEGAKKAGRSE
jgi:hypothetical protein